MPELPFSRLIHYMLFSGRLFVIFSGLWLGMLSGMGQVYSESQNLDDNQLPAGWAWGSDSGRNYGFSGGCLYAYEKNGKASLVRSLFFTNAAIKSVRIGWTGNMGKVYNGIQNHGTIALGGGYFSTATSERKTYFWGTDHVAYIGPYLSPSSGGSLRLVPGETGSFRNSLLVENGHALFEVRRLSDGSLYNSFATNIALLQMNQATNVVVSFTVAFTSKVQLTGDDIPNGWIDDLSIVVELDTNAAPIIVSQPQPQAAAAGTSVTFSSAATGTLPLSCQWWRCVGGSGSPISGATNCDYTFTCGANDDESSYYMVVSNAVGTATTDYSNFVLLGPPLFITQPTNLTVTQGSVARFCVSTRGHPVPSYQWMTNGLAVANGGRCSGTTTPTMTVNGVQTNDAIGYSVVASNSYGCITSQIATLTVLVPPSIVQQPISLVVTQGNTAVFSVAVGGTTPLGYQWRSNGVNLADGERAYGARTSTLSIAGALTNDALNYTVVITNSAGSVTSQVASLTVLVSPYFTSGTNIAGKQGNLLSFTNIAGGTLRIAYYS